MAKANLLAKLANLTSSIVVITSKKLLVIQSQDRPFVVAPDVVASNVLLLHFILFYVKLPRCGHELDKHEPSTNLTHLSHSSHPQEKLDKVIHDALQLAIVCKRKTVTVMDVVKAMKLNGMDIYGHGYSAFPGA